MKCRRCCSGCRSTAKSLRGALQADGRAVHLLSAMTHAERVVIAQCEVDHKTNEIKAFCPLLENLDLTDCLVTADAMHPQRDHANFLVDEKHAEFLLFVKENQPSLYNEMVCMGADRFAEPYSEVGKGHGRIETKTIRVAATPDGLVEFPHVGAVVRIDRQVRDAKTGERRWHDTAWAVSSASTRRAAPPRLLTASREHCGIDNGLHWVRDATMGEDASKVRSTSAPRALAVMRNLVISRVAPRRRDQHRSSVTQDITAPHSRVRPPRPVIKANTTMSSPGTGRPDQAEPPPPPAARPPAWALLEQAIAQRRSVSACCHAEQRLFCTR